MLHFGRSCQWRQDPDDRPEKATSTASPSSTWRGSSSWARAPSSSPRPWSATLSDDHGHVIIDFSKINFIDSTGIGELVGYLGRFRNSKRELILVNPSDRIRKLLQVARLDRCSPSTTPWRRPSPPSGRPGLPVRPRRHGPPQRPARVLALRRGGGLSRPRAGWSPGWATPRPRPSCARQPSRSSACRCCWPAARSASASTPADLALICASHSGDPEHVRRAADLLARGGFGDGGPALRRPSAARPRERRPDAARGRRADAAPQQLLGQARRACSWPAGCSACRPAGYIRPGPPAAAAHPGARAGGLPRAARGGAARGRRLQRARLPHAARGRGPGLRGARPPRAAGLPRGGGRGSGPGGAGDDRRAGDGGRAAGGSPPA